MPAAAVASLTPAISGMAGISVGASGEMEVDMGGALSRRGHQYVHARAFGPGMHAKYSTLGAKSIYFFAGAILLSAGFGGAAGLVVGVFTSPRACLFSRF